METLIFYSGVLNMGGILLVYLGSLIFLQQFFEKLSKKVGLPLEPIAFLVYIIFGTGENFMIIPIVITGIIITYLYYSEFLTFDF